MSQPEVGASADSQPLSRHRGPGQAPDPDEGHSQYSEEDVLDQILDNYNFICHPELRLKFKQELQNCSVGLALAKPWHHRPRLRVVVKPTGGGRVSRALSKVLMVPTHGVICLYSTKIPISILRLQFMASYNWVTRQPTLDYRITTKWSDGARIKRKETYNIGKHALVRAKWNMDLRLPDLEGHLGADDTQRESMEVDYGSMDFEISQVDLLIHSPWDYRRPEDETSQALQLEPAPKPTAKGLPAAPGQRPAEQPHKHIPDTLPAGIPSDGIVGTRAFKQVVEPVQQPASSLVPKEDSSNAPPDWLISFLSKLSVQPYQPGR